MTSAIDVLKAIDIHTINGHISWEMIEPDVYAAQTTGGPITIEFAYPMLGGEISGGADVAQVSIANVNLAFYEGTEGMYLVRSILEHALPDFAEHSSVIEERLRRFV